MKHPLRLVPFLGAIAFTLLFMCVPEQGMAATGGGSQVADTCTTFTSRVKDMTEHKLGPEGAILSDIYRFIVDITQEATEKLFTAFTSSDEYQIAVSAAMTLMIIFYAMAFTMGVVQASFQQLLVRLMKYAIVFTLVSPVGWDFFSENVVAFFQDGTDDLIIKIQSIALGGIVAPDGATPFWALDNVANFIIQPDTIIALVGSLGAGGPYGPMMGGLMLIAMGGFIKMLLNVLKTYAICYVARAMVLGLAPIFFVFLLFDRTKQMFISWLNALVNLSLRPLLLFTFLSFFLVMMESATANMLKSELCWGDFRNVEGSTNKLAFWRFRDAETKAIVTGDYTYEGALECLISSNPSKCKEFPVDIVSLLSFLILIYISLRFTSVVDSMAAELSNAVVGLDSSGRFEDFMRKQSESQSKVSLNPKGGGASR